MRDKVFTINDDGRICETSSELKDVLYENMILNIKGGNYE